MSPSSLPPDAQLAREALRRRIDAELEQIGPINVSSWMMGLSSKPAPAPVRHQDQWATLVEIEARLGRLLWKESAKLKEGQCFHVLTSTSQLVAVLKPETGATYLKEQVLITEMRGWQLQRRPAAAFSAPPGYRRTTITAALWRFALFDLEGNKVLPRRYREVPLVLRQLPAVERDMVPVRQVKLMQMISRKAYTFTELLALTQLSDEQLSRDLAALYLARSLRALGPPQAASA